MTLWRKARTEVAGVWRSVRFDLGRPEPDADELRERRQLLPRPSRVLVVSVFGCLAVAGAAGGYFAVVTGLGSLVGDKQTGVEPYPLAVEAPRDEPAHSGLGGGSADIGSRAPAGGATPAEPAPGTIRVLPATSVVPAATVVPATVVSESPVVVVPRPRETTVGEKPVTDCCPTTPSTPSSSPESPSPSPSPSVSSPDTVDSPEPSESPSPATPPWPEDIGELDEDFAEPGRYEDPWHPAHHP